jgi:hypothetical protein
MKTTVYAWGAEKNNVLHIYAGVTTQKDITTRLSGIKDISVGPANSWFVGPEGSSLGVQNLDLIFANSTQNYSRYKEQKAINAVWAIEQKYRNASLPVRAMNTNRAVRLNTKNGGGNYTDLRFTSVYGHVLSHLNELEAQSDYEVFLDIESWIKEKVQDSTTLKRKFETIIKAKSKKEAMIKNITKVLGLEPVLV